MYLERIALRLKHSPVESRQFYLQTYCAHEKMGALTIRSLIGEDNMEDQTDYVSLAADIVGAYVGNNSVAAADLPALIQSVHAALSATAVGAPAAPEAEPLKPAVSVKKSVMPDYIICLEDGKQFKSLKRHLSTKFGLSPEEYRAKWGLPADYPMVALNYAASRSELAKKMGLGQQRAAAAATKATPVKRSKKAA